MPNCETSCENCPVTGFVAGGACCCKDYSDSGFPSCEECMSCTYMTREECVAKEEEQNNCPNPLGNGGSYECDCTFYPELICGDLVDESCFSGSTQASELEYTPLVIPVLGSRVPPKLISSYGITPVPSGREQLSGVLCSNNTCDIIYDLYDYIVENGSFPRELDDDNNYQVFLPYVPEIYTHLDGLSKINLPVGQNGREHFLQMISIGGHGINRPMSPEEMVIMHSDEHNSDLTVSHFKAMKIVYEVEKTITQSDPAGIYDWFTENSNVDGYCGCGNEILSDIEMESAGVYFPNVSSPSEETNCINIIVPKHTEHYVARKLGGVYSGNKCNSSVSKQFNSNKKNIEDIVGGEGTLINMQTMEGPSGRCSLPDGTITYCDEKYCKNGLGGNWNETKAIDSELIRHRTARGGHSYKRRENNK